MITVYKDADYMAAYKQKKKIWGIFWGITLGYLAICIAWWLYYISLPYKDPMQNLPKMTVYVLSAIYVAIVFPYMAIKYSRVRRYYKLLNTLSEGLKNEEKNYFYCFEEKSLQKENIDVMGCVFETWSKKKCEWMEREAYFDVEKPLPEFESGDYVRYIVQSNFIVQYEFIQKKALEFEEIDEDDEEYEETAEETMTADEEKKEKNEGEQV